MEKALDEEALAPERSQPRRIAGRPLGVAVIAALQAIHAAALILSFELARPIALDPVGPIEQIGSFSPLTPIATILGFAIAAGLWWFRPWAWYATMLWVGATMAGALVAYWDGDPIYPVMAISVAISFYLNQWEVRQAFGTLPGGKRHT